MPIIQKDKMRDITPEFLRAVLHYDPMTGNFHWKRARPGHAVLGRRTGDGRRDHYGRICIDGRRYYAHRLAWLYVYGRWPRYLLDHKNGDRGDNRLSNLRECDNQQNCSHGPIKKNNALGLKGVRRLKNRYTARITVKSVPIFIGSFATPEEAHAAYCAAAAQHFGQFARFE